jgi:tripartite-type tricarboxylate transporter receptor subunit TctC
VPTLDEAGVKGFEATAWFGILAPAGTPRAVLERLGRETDAVARDPAFRARIEPLGGDPPGLTPDGGTSPAAFEAFLAAERRKWAEVARRSGAKVE